MSSHLSTSVGERTSQLESYMPCLPDMPGFSMNPQLQSSLTPMQGQLEEQVITTLFTAFLDLPLHGQMNNSSLAN